MTFSLNRRIASSISIKIPSLSTKELHDGCELLIDSGADTCCAGRHAYILDIIPNMTVSCRGFSDNLPIEDNLPIANVIYAYDSKDRGEVILLRLNYCIYLGNKKCDAIACPNQLRLHGISVDERPSSLFPNESETQQITADGVVLPLLLRGPLTYLPIRRPTSNELQNDELQVIALTSPHGWDPYGIDSLCKVISMAICPISHQLSSSIMRRVQPIQVKSRRAISPEDLVSRWGIGIESARSTLLSTYQEYTRESKNLSRRFKTSRAHSRFRTLFGPYSTFYTDTLFHKVVSLRGNTCGQIFYNKCRFYKFYPLKRKEDSHTTLLPLFTLAGIPSTMHSDRAPDLVSGTFGRILQKYRVRRTTTEPNTPQQNRAEGEGVKPVKKLGTWLMFKNGAPLRLWDYAFELAAQILTLTCQPHIAFGERTGFEVITQTRPDISEYASFNFYAWIWHWDETNRTKSIGRWLGVAESIGAVMTFWILPISCIPIPRSSITHIQDNDLDSPVVQKMMATYDSVVASKLGDHSKYLTNKSSPVDLKNKYADSIRTLHESTLAPDLWDGDVDALPFEPTSEETAMEQLDEYIGTEITLATKNGPELVKVKSRQRDGSGKLIGTKHSKSALDTRLYNVQFNDGHFEQYSTNVLSEALMDNCDSNGFDTGFIHEISGHRSNSHALPKGKGHFTSKNGNRCPKVTLQGWELSILWKDGATTWVPLSILKNSIPDLVAEYAKNSKLVKEPAFQWWVPHVLRKKSRIISKVLARFHKSNRKFGIAIPRNYDEAILFDTANGNHFWRNAIEKEMANVKVAFKFLNEGAPPPPGYTPIKCFIIFDVKMDLTRKARFVAGGHLTDPPTSMTYASVVSRESVRIALLLAALNQLNILSGDIGNAYLNAATTEKIYYRAGNEWGPLVKGRVLVIIRALYGLKTSANAWRTHFCNTIQNKLKFKFSHADNDVWYKQDVRPDGTKYYSYILVYTDDILIVSHDPKRYMDQLEANYYVKPESIKFPDIYLGSRVKRVNDRSGNPAYATSSNDYVTEAIKVVESRMKALNLSFTKSAKSPSSPFSNIKYKPELDVTTFCSEDEHQLYHQAVGILRWMIEIGRIDITVEVSLLSRYLSNPRTGHLVQLLHVFSFLKSNECMDLCYDPTRLVITEPTILPQERAAFRATIMRSMYPDAVEDIPPNMPVPLGRAVQINAFVDADLAGELTTRRSQTGILIFLNMAPIIWYSKRQTTVEASTYGSEFVAMRILVEMLIGLRYKLRMFGIHIDGPCNVFCDNDAVAKTTMRAETTLKKKHLSIAYHKSREAVACGIMLVFYERSGSNLSDLFTKVLASLDRKRIMSYICGKTQRD